MSQSHRKNKLILVHGDTDAKENLKSETVNVEAVLADLEIKRKSIELDAERAAELKHDAERRLKNIENEISS